MSLQLYMLVLSVLMSVSLNTQKSQLRDPIGTPECTAWVDSVYATLSPQERIAQLMVVNASPAGGDKSKANIRILVDKYHVGGLYFSKGTSAQFAEMTNYAQSLSRVPLLMGIDGEWGPAMRVEDAPVFPYNVSLGAIQDPTLLYLFGKEVGRECRVLGVQTDFAPVLDVNSNPDNPVIGRRSFGEDPKRVALAGLACSLGMESEGVMSSAKHFPGHGDTNTDSHKALPTITHDMNTLENVDLVPFRDYIRANCGSVMVGHLSVPALDKSGTPASMSKKIVTDLLKDKMGFKGLVITDALAMKGATSSSQNPCVGALLAGADILLNPASVADGIKAVEAAIHSGKIKQSVVDERCKTMLAYKYALGLTHAPKVNAKTVKAQLNTPEALSLVQTLTDASVTAISNKDNILPISHLDSLSIAVVNIGAPADNSFSQMCSRYAAVDTYGAPKGSPLSASALAAIKGHDVVVAAVYGDTHQDVSALASLKGCKNLVTVFLIGPYKTSKFDAAVKDAKAVVMLYDNTKYSRLSAAKAVFGGCNISGKLPVNVQGIGKLGDGVDIEQSRLGFSSPEAKGLTGGLQQKVDSVVNKALAAGAFQGAQVVVVKDGDVVIDSSYGYTTKGGEKVTDATVFDLASVSKAVGTLPGVMKAYDMGMFDLDTPAYKYVPGLKVEGKEDITPRMLLYHESGIPASVNMYDVMMDPASYTGKVVSGKRDRTHTVAINGGGFGHNTARLRSDIVKRGKSKATPYKAAEGLYVGQEAFDTIMQRIYNIPLRSSRKYVYSCLNFCLLMDMEQRLTGKPHQEWVEESIWEPIGATSLCYRPTEKYALSQIAATENDNYLRKQHVHGTVHDETAAFSGGVQGNAGVFGNALDVAKLCQMWLNGGKYGNEQILSEPTTKLFTTSKSPTSRRGLGFDKPDTSNQDNSPTCIEASAATYGHTGFTGTCFWVDPEEDLIFVFLSNRVDPSRKNPAFTQSAIRPTLMSLVYNSMDKQ